MELSTARGRRENGCFLVEGIRSILQIYTTCPAALDELLLSETHDALPEGLDVLPCRKMSLSHFKKITSSVTPQGVAAVVTLPSDVYSDIVPSAPGSRLLLLEDVQDPGNVGTLIRTAAAFSIDGIVMSEKCADPFSSKVVQASAGSLFGLWIRRTKQYMGVLSELKKNGYKLFCTDLSGTSTLDFNGTRKVIVALGNEGAGISRAIRDVADYTFSIPMDMRAVESLNVSVAGGIALFALYTNCGWKR